ncbi:hypothetical protein J32TS6_20180 [Virgibacillus pantothenticus]|nr:hypothetical protein J32TS6_20180 [Virgibacillus pantothenticus]
MHGILPRIKGYVRLPLQELDIYLYGNKSKWEITASKYPIRSSNNPWGMNATPHGLKIYFIHPL